MTGTTQADDHIAITQLVHRYAYLVRHGRAGECGTLFTEDARYHIGEVDASDAGNPPVVHKTIEGSAAIGDYLAGTGRGGVRLCPLIHNLLVEIDGDTGSATSINEARTWPGGREFIGEYDDRVARVDGQWLFTARTFLTYRPAAAAGQPA